MQAHHRTVETYHSALEAHHGALEAHRGALEAHRGDVEAPMAPWRVAMAPWSHHGGSHQRFTVSDSAITKNRLKHHDFCPKAWSAGPILRSAVAYPQLFQSTLP